MITCQLYGRLGNQLSQISAVIAYSLRHGIKYAIPQEITCPPGLSTDPVYFTHFPKPPMPIKGGTLKYGQSFHELPDQSYTELPSNLIHFDKQTDTFLSGYFQSEKYFADQREGVIKALAPAFTMTSTNPNEGRGMVSIHVRRGDYLEKPECHPFPGLWYYNCAVRYFVNKGYSKFVVFSDDLIWCKDNINQHTFGRHGNHIRFTYSQNQSALEDLQSMSKCDHHIIANSSFSWWGAWLNENPDKIVIAPKTWYGPELSHIDTKDLVPEKWIRM